ncbi:MAG TPA: Uma2 family endonuclease [Rhodopila sp.]|jgi:Uma2 family endonuclease|nr:Uma2 family endonuclease [Rhodopila sp.]
MSHAVADPPPTTIAEFDAFLDAQADEALWELVAGRIVMMTNPSENHEQIAGNIGAPLKLAMDQRGCRAYQGGMRVQRSDDSRDIHKPRPDVLVRCGPTSNRHYVTDPCVIVEVLSPSTMDGNRGDKLHFYKSLPTLRHIVLAYQDDVRVEHYRRSDTGWDIETLTRPTVVLVLEAVGFTISLDTIYFGVVFDEE